MKNKMEHIYMYLLFLLIYWWKSWKGWQIAEEAESACFAKYEVFFVDLVWGGKAKGFLFFHDHIEHYFVNTF